MKDYDGPAFKGKNRPLNTRHRNPGANKFQFEPAFKKGHKSTIKKGGDPGLPLSSEIVQGKEAHQDDSHYQVPFLKEKGKEPKLFQQDNHPDVLVPDEKTPSARSQYQPSMIKDEDRHRDFMDLSKDSVDPEETKAYHKTSRSHYQPSLRKFEAEESSQQDYQEDYLSQEETRMDELEALDTEAEGSPKELARPEQKADKEENLRELSQRLVKSKESFLLFEQGDGNRQDDDG